jgi:hypothetical protein
MNLETSWLPYSVTLIKIWSSEREPMMVDSLIIEQVIGGGLEGRRSVGKSRDRRRNAVWVTP